MTWQRALTLVVVLGLLLTAALVALGWPAIAYRDNDFAGFWVGSRMLLDGTDPYDFGVFLDMHQRIGSRGLAINPPGTAFGYPFTTALVFAPFALVPVSVAAPLWLITQVALATAALVALARRLMPHTLRRDLPVLLAVGGASQPAWLLAAGGNLGGYLLATAATSATLLLAGRPFAAGAVAGLLVVKPHPLLIALPLVLLAVPRRAALRVLAGAALVAGATTLVSLALRPSWIGEFLVPFARIGGAPVPRSTVFGLLGPALGPLAWIVAAGVVFVFVLWTRTPRPMPVVVALAIPISLFCIPYGWSYDQLTLLVTAAVIVALAAGAPQRVRTSLMLALALVLVPLTWTLYAIAFQRGNEAWSAITPLALALLVVFAMRASPAVLARMTGAMWHDATTDGRPSHDGGP